MTIHHINGATKSAPRLSTPYVIQKVFRPIVPIYLYI